MQPEKTPSSLVSTHPDPIDSDFIELADKMSFNDIYAYAMTLETLSICKLSDLAHKPPRSSRPSSKLVASFFWALNRACSQGMQGKMSSIPTIETNLSGTKVRPTFFIIEAKRGKTFRIETSEYIDLSQI